MEFFKGDLYSRDIRAIFRFSPSLLSELLFSIAHQNCSCNLCYKNLVVNIIFIGFPLTFSHLTEHRNTDDREENQRSN